MQVIPSATLGVDQCTSMYLNLALSIKLSENTINFLPTDLLALSTVRAQETDAGM